ncbi:MAG TPA: ABC transporter permease [Bryobacteraceae bacterium]|nr:ABC transporter permease [Bryobacteraceae bacterium]
MLADLNNDLRYAVRGLVRNPGFALAAILTLALGIGSVTSIFSVADAVLLRPLPYPHQDRLVMVYDQLTKLRLDRLPPNLHTVTPYSKSGVFERTGEFRPYDTTVTGAGEATRVIADAVSASLMPMLGVAPAIGRGFTDAENQPGHGNVAILSHEFFTEHLGGDPNVLRRAITLDGSPYTIIGVMPPRFEFTQIDERTDIWTPLQLADRPDWGTFRFSMIARLKPGVSINQAQAALDPIAKHLDQDEHLYHGPNGEDPGYRVKVISLHEDLLGKFRPATLLLLAAVAALLLIALVNVSNLLLARTVSREKEFAVRRAIGATQARLARQWIAEAAVLAIIGGSLGAIASYWGVRALVALSPAGLPAVTRVSVDARALALTLAIAALVSLLFGLTPLLSPSNLRTHRKKRTAPALIAGDHAPGQRIASSEKLHRAAPHGQGFSIRSPADHATRAAPVPLSRRAPAYRLLRGSSRPPIGSAGRRLHRPGASSPDSRQYAAEPRRESLQH